MILTVKDLKNHIEDLPDDGEIAIVNYTGGGGSWSMGILGLVAFEGNLAITVTE